MTDPAGPCLVPSLMLVWQNRRGARLHSSVRGTSLSLAAEGEDCSPVEDLQASPSPSSPEEQQPSRSTQEEAESEVDAAKREAGPEDAVDGDSAQSMEALLADWKEDLEAFQQMEKDEL